MKAMMPKALSLDRMVMVALLGVPSLTPLEELWNAERKETVTPDRLSPVARHPDQ